MILRAGTIKDMADVMRIFSEARLAQRKAGFQLWNVTKPYAVFHRIAISDEYRGKRMSSTLFDLSELKAQQSGAQFIRIDTGLENRPMQHILSKRGYSDLGCCNFAWGERLAYEKRLI